MICPSDIIIVYISMDELIEFKLEVTTVFDFDDYFDEDPPATSFDGNETYLNSSSRLSKGTEAVDDHLSGLQNPGLTESPETFCNLEGISLLPQDKAVDDSELIDNSKNTLDPCLDCVTGKDQFLRAKSYDSNLSPDITESDEDSIDSICYVNNLFTYPYFYSNVTDKSCQEGVNELEPTECAPRIDDPVLKKLGTHSLASSSNSVFIEDEFLGALNVVDNDAEARLAARRQARAEAREIRMRELEKQQRESEDSLDRHYEQHSDSASRTNARLNSVNRTPGHLSVGAAGTYSSSRRSSEDSTESEGLSYRDLRHELKELEDKFRKAMINNAQLDNEKSTLLYQVNSLKDEREELEENLAMVQKEFKERCHDYEQMKRVAACLKEETNFIKRQLEEKDKLIKEHGLVIICSGNGDEEESNNEKVLVSEETASILEGVGEGSLDVRLKRFVESKNELEDQIRRLKIELEEEKSRNLKMSKLSSGTMNGPELDLMEAHRESNRLLGDYKFKLQKAEQEISTLQANVTRLDGQVVRYKTLAETSEKSCDELKVEKRRLQREVRELQTKVDELEITNSHLQKRLDKLKTARSAFLKDL